MQEKNMRHICPIGRSGVKCKMERETHLESFRYILKVPRFYVRHFYLTIIYFFLLFLYFVLLSVCALEHVNL